MKKKVTPAQRKAMIAGQKKRQDNIKKFQETFARMIEAAEENPPGGKLTKMLKEAHKWYSEVFSRPKGGHLPDEYYEEVNALRMKLGIKPLKSKSERNVA